MKLLKKIARKIRNQVVGKFYYQRWVIGVARVDIKEVIQQKNFDASITWLTVNKLSENYADPFILKTDSGYDIFYERYPENGVGDIWLMKIDEDFQIESNVPIFEDPIHASFPFLYRENGKIYMIPETAGEKKLFRFEYDEDSSTVSHKDFILHQSILDPTILKYDDKYWLFGAKRDKETGETYESWVYTSEKLGGPYKSHPRSPYVTGLDGIRAAGNFIKIGDVIYRPTQNCEEEYGKSITINKIQKLSETEIKEEFYMSISIDNKKNKDGIVKIHTINSAGNVIAIDGVQRTFSVTKPFKLLKKYLSSKNIF